MPRILVVEDDKLIGTLLAAMLEDMNLQVCAIETTERGAVEAALRLRPDMMIVDARLGQGSGIAAMVEIARHLAIPHIFMSGGRLTSLDPELPILLKPFNEQQLSEAIRQVLCAPQSEEEEVLF
jgi:DNA-binding response OmpR family regulator